MGKIKFTAFVASIKGTFGGTVVKGTFGGGTSIQRKAQVSPSTLQTITWRSAFAAAAGAWQGLPADYKEQWRLAAPAGSTAYEYFMSYNINSMFARKVVYELPQHFEPISSIDSGTVNYDSTSNSFTWTPTDNLPYGDYKMCLYFQYPKEIEPTKNNPSFNSVIYQIAWDGSSDIPLNLPTYLLQLISTGIHYFYIQMRCLPIDATSGYITDKLLQTITVTPYVTVFDGYANNPAAADTLKLIMHASQPVTWQILVDGVNYANGITQDELFLLNAATNPTVHIQLQVIDQTYITYIGATSQNGVHAYYSIALNGSLPNLTRFAFNYNQLNSDTVNSVLEYAVVNTPALGNIQIADQQPAAPPTSDGIIAKNTLIARGVTVLTD